MKKMRLMTMISWIAGLALLLSACSGPIAFIQKSQHDSGSPANGLTPGSINGWVWHDACASGLDGELAPAETPAGCVKEVSAIGGYHADGVMGVDEKPIAGVIVRLGQGACPSTGLDQAITIDTDLSYTFTGLKAGTYCVSIDPFEKANQDVLLPGIWTSPKLREGLMGATINLASGENKMDVNFGWDHQFKPDTSPLTPGMSMACAGVAAPGWSMPLIPPAGWGVGAIGFAEVGACLKANNPPAASPPTAPTLMNSRRDSFFMV